VRRAVRDSADVTVDALKPERTGPGIGPALRDTASRVSDAFADISGRLFGGGNDTQAPEMPQDEPEARKSVLLPLALGAVAIGGIYLATKGGAA